MKCFHDDTKIDIHVRNIIPLVAEYKDISVLNGLVILLSKFFTPKYTFL